MNTLFPGRPDYTGPASGVFGLLHHDLLVETSHNVNERVAYVKRAKPKHQVAIRLYNMIYLGNCKAAVKYDVLYTDFAAKRGALCADYAAKRGALYADYAAKRDALYDNYEAKRGAPTADYAAKRGALTTDYVAKCEALYVASEAKRAPLIIKVTAYIRKHIPDTAWNGSTLVF